MGINNIYKRTLTFVVKDDGVLSFGQRVYVVSETSCRTYTEKCFVCDDTRKINVRGYEFDCPYCRGYGQRMSANAISVYNYEAREFIINKLEICGEKVKTAYKTDGSIFGDRYPYVRYSGFAPSQTQHKKTKGFSGFDFNKHDPDKVLLPQNINEEYCFLSKSEAEKFIKRIHERQVELLKKFNAEHSTAHEYPYEY